MNESAKSLLDEYKTFTEEAKNEGKDVSEALRDSDEWTVITRGDDSDE